VAIRFVNVGAVASAASGNLSVTPPATVSGDIMVCAVTSLDTVACTFPAGWTVELQGNNGTITATVAWKRAVGAEGAFTITHAAGGSILARVANYRGCIGSGNAVNFSSLSSNAASTQCSVVASPTDPNCMVIFTNHLNANTTGFTNHFAKNVRGNPRLMERFLRLGDTAGSGSNTIFVDLADGFQPMPFSGLLSATVSASAANYAGVVVLRSARSIVMRGGKIGKNVNKVVVGNNL
jgi:hypothetical protein